MKNCILFIGLIFTAPAVAADGYCKLENVPAVRTALNNELNRIKNHAGASSMLREIRLTGAASTIIKFSGMGDAREYYGRGILAVPTNSSTLGDYGYQNILLSMEYGTSSGRCLDQPNATQPRLIYTSADNIHVVSID